MLYEATFAGIQLKFGVHKVLLTNVLNSDRTIFRDHVWTKIRDILKSNSKKRKETKRALLNNLKKKNIIVFNVKPIKYFHIDR